MKKISNPFQNKKWDTVILIVLLAVLAYLPLITQLGYYRDDWHVIWSGLTRGASSIIDLHIVDRPFMGIVYSLVFRFWEGSRIAWQLYGVMLRLGGTLSFFWLVRLLWPTRRLETACMAALFVIYPGFLQLPEANAYQVHLLAVIAGILSLALTLKGWKAQGFAKILWLVSSAFLAALCYMIMEWMVGIEIIRPLLIYWKETELSKENFWKRIRRVFLLWLPNLAVFLAFFVWRVFIFKSARPTTDLGALKQLYAAQPFAMLLRLAVETLKDFYETIFTAYFVPLYNLTVHARIGDYFVGLILGLIGAGIFLLFWKSFRHHEETDFTNGLKTAIGVGVIFVVATLLPVILSNRDVQFQDTFDRYTLLAMSGAVMILVGLLSFLKHAWRGYILAGLIFISIFTHFSNAVYFKDFWTVQRQTWWQLSWRAPDIQDETTLIVSLPSAYRLAEGYEAWGPANLIYRPESQEIRIPAEVLNDETLLRMLKQEKFGKTFRRVSYTIDFQKSLLLSMTGTNACLHVLDAERGEISEYENASIRLLTPFSNENFIVPQGSSPVLREDVFGSEPDHGWCFYYQKASLARQQENWEEVVRLGDEAREKGLTTQDISEWMPFYEGYAHQGRMDDANEIGSYLREDEEFISLYCIHANSLPEPVEKIEKFIRINICGE